MQIAKKIYFASDFHLGSYPKEQSEIREREIVKWLDHIKQDASELYLVGDIFDFWFEYSTVVPKGYIRFLGKLAELADLGIKITLFKGNHDMWMFGYLKKEIGATIIDNELILNLNGKSCYIHHGDGLGPGDKKYKVLKKVFRSSFCQWLFARLHPNLGIGIAQRWSKHSRISNNSDEKFLGEDKEWLIQYANDILHTQHYDYFIFGHRHFPYEIELRKDSKIINLGEWINYYTYAVWDGQTLNLQRWNS
ncbi:UDP-2,3-diacylglucosamine diphosphatase [Sphingobacterium tabacisoli]|uniref:UDP-2,3-diacylglucosamine diphosphatase n=1 Tax=Sphingobacterium tabacisoli TaxID=2044855 RepID=A0ABW5L540_9SPHI|nr:UDP-2,3-diacylglucosamine diphosphatase [Sphingobacterium tabacisoli]